MIVPKADFDHHFDVLTDEDTLAFLEAKRLMNAKTDAEVLRWLLRLHDA